MALDDTIRIPISAADKAKLQRIADKNDRTLAWVVRDAISRYLKGARA